MMNEEERKPYIIYAEILEVIKATQGELDELDAVRRDRLYNMDQLEKCRKKQTRIKQEQEWKKLEMSVYGRMCALGYCSSSAR